MEKLNREERGKIASVLIQSISKLCNVPCGASYDDIGYEEATAKKAHSVLCAILAYMFFVLGTCYSDHEERSEMYHLIWETVFLLIFAEWAAEEILEYSGEKGADQDV